MPIKLNCLMLSGAMMLLSLFANAAQPAITSKPTLVSIVAKPRFESLEKFTRLVISNTNRDFQIYWTYSTNAPLVPVTLDTNRVYTFTVTEMPHLDITVPELQRIQSDGQTIYDVEVCEVHKIKMKHKEVEIIYGLVVPGAGEPSADIERKSFPHHRKYSLGGCTTWSDSPKSTKIYFCSDCKSAYQTWKMFTTKTK